MGRLKRKNARKRVGDREPSVFQRLLMQNVGDERAQRLRAEFGWPEPKPKPDPVPRKTSDRTLLDFVSGKETS